MSKQRTYWDAISDNYDSEIFDVLSNDRKHLILRTIKKYSNKAAVAGDIGCGTGRFLPALSASFKKVYAIDISPNLIRRAKAENSGCENITYLRKDLASAATGLPGIDFALSVNAFLDPSVSRRDRMFDHVCGRISRGGIFLLVVPSIESKLLADQMLIEMNRRKGLKGTALMRSGSDSKNRILNNGLQQGNVLIDGVSTKHYLKEELKFTLGKRGFSILRTEKIEYTWSIEFKTPPHWMGEPFPWDWLVLARK